jgi:hypothetical protein
VIKKWLPFCQQIQFGHHSTSKKNMGMDGRTMATKYASSGASRDAWANARRIWGCVDNTAAKHKEVVNEVIIGGAEERGSLVGDDFVRGSGEVVHSGGRSGMVLRS